MFLLIKLLHILSAITAVGANITYGVWIRRASKNPEFLPFTLKSIKLIDSRLANPAYGFLLITGLLMAFLKPFPLTTPWLLIALILYALAAVLGILVYAPLSRRQIRILEKEGFDSPNYITLARRSSLLGMVVAVLTVAIVVLMVVKPTLWGPSVEEETWLLRLKVA
jgi:uncharacterized membrane protein